MNKVPHHSIGFQIQSDLSFITLKGIGFHYINTTPYSWNNRNRKDQHCLLQYTVSGSGMLEENYILYPQNKGDAFLIDIPGESHYYLPKTSEFWEVIYLEFSKDCLPILYKIKSILSSPILHLQNESNLSNKIFEIYKMALNDQIKNSFDNSKIAYSFFMDLLEFANSNPNKTSAKALEAKKYIESNYFNPDLSLDKISEHIGVSKFYIIHEFTKEFGISPSKYLTYFRIQQSCKLLQELNNYTLNEIAKMVGFSNDNYFGKVFKRNKGITPTQYRYNNNQYDFVRIMHNSKKT